jgi:hypothetical protein
MRFFHEGDNRYRNQPHIYFPFQQAGRDPGRIVNGQAELIDDGMLLNSIKQGLCIQITHCAYTYFSVQVLYLNFGCKSNTWNPNKAKQFSIK